MSGPAADAGPPRVEVVGATVRFGDRTALADVRVAVAPGEVVAVLGPSGSGKSTLLRAVAGLQPLDRGVVRIDGVDQARVPTHRRGVGLMFQDQALFPHRDVAGNVAFGLRMQGRDRAAIDRRVAELLELVGLPGAQRRPVTELSGGEQQRVALARALAPAPRVLLLDEPLGALDRVRRDQLVADLRHLFSEQALTVVTVTHDQAEAFTLADRLVVMDEGQVVQTGPPPAVWRSPRDRRVASLLGLSNVVTAPVEAGTARTPWGPVPVPDGATGTVDVLVRPAGVVVDDAGPLAVEVRVAAFQGSRTLLELAVVGDPDAPPLHAEVATDDAPERGSRVRVRVDPSAVQVLGPDPAPARA